MYRRPAISTVLILPIFGTILIAQQAPPAAASAVNPLTITLQDALKRAQQYGTQVQLANIAAALAREDRAQAKAATLPSISALNQFIYTEGNGTPSGVFVANDGVHIYNEQAIAHEELLALIRRGEVHLADATAAVARAQADVAARGLDFTVVQDYYAIAVAQRRLVNAQRTLQESQQFLGITQKQEQGGEAAHADVIKAQLQVQQHQRDLQDANLAIKKAKIALAILIFPALRLDYSIVDDLAQLKLLPPLPEVSAQVESNNPELHVARASVTAAKLGVTVARYAYLPSLGLDVFYGIDANQFAIQTNYPTQATGRSTLPNFQVEGRRNLGYVAQATLTVPIWNWGSIHSRVKQAQLRQQQAQFDLTAVTKQTQAGIASAYQEAQTALSQVQSLRSSSDLAAESLRLTLLRYQAGEATALEVVDAQTSASLARGAYDDGLLRYRLAIANVQLLTGSF